MGHILSGDEESLLKCVDAKASKAHGIASPITSLDGSTLKLMHYGLKALDLSCNIIDTGIGPNRIQVQHLGPIFDFRRDESGHWRLVQIMLRWYGSHAGMLEREAGCVDPST
jgi:hypothetical protein